MYWIGDAETSGKGRGKDEVWAQQEGETSLYWGYVKKTKIQDEPCVREGVTTVEPIRPVPTSSRSNCRVDVRAVDPPVPIGSHLFIVASKENGVEYGYRGGPDVPGGLFALIETDFGRYEQGLFPDWDPAAQSVTVLSGAGACGMAECFSQKCRDIDAAEIGYELHGPNSNSVISQLLSSCGAPRTKPDVWAPGWDTSLFDPDL